MESPGAYFNNRVRRIYFCLVSVFVRTPVWSSGGRCLAYGLRGIIISSPLLFILFINDLPNSSTLFKFMLFADDCLCTSFTKESLCYLRMTVCVLRLLKKVYAICG